MLLNVSTLNLPLQTSKCPKENLWFETKLRDDLFVYVSKAVNLHNVVISSALPGGNSGLLPDIGVP